MLLVTVYHNPKLPKILCEIHAFLSDGISHNSVLWLDNYKVIIKRIGGEIHNGTCVKASLLPRAPKMKLLKILLGALAEHVQESRSLQSIAMH